MTSHNKQRTNNNLSQQRTNNEPLTTNKGPITTSHNKQRTNNDLSQQTKTIDLSQQTKDQSFVCCERLLLDLCLLWEDHYWSSECCEMVVIGPLFIVRGPILVLSLLWEVNNEPSATNKGQYWSSVCWKDQYWSKGPITTSFVVKGQ